MLQKDLFTFAEVLFGDVYLHVIEDVDILRSQWSLLIKV